mmetsp:Transcript_33303/g.30252  ORF Transcript_33303/g.30252 Transcript_33303/m.30252 type:complete len:84 (+) Transcript_33303:1399-1650(+)
MIDLMSTEETTTEQKADLKKDLTIMDNLLKIFQNEKVKSYYFDRDKYKLLSPKITYKPPPKQYQEKVYTTLEKFDRPTKVDHL